MSDSKSYPLSFTGRGSEYFKIWIVNILLSIVTVGIYSAWAKVRTQRWFYGHTVLDGQPFTYLATPMQLLMGRLIAFAVLVVFALAKNFMPTLALVLFLALIIATPWLVVAGLRFNARMSAYRGIRFDFTGGMKEATVIFLLLPLLIPFTLGLILPYLAYRQVRYLVDNSRYGDTVGCFKGTVKQYFSVYMVMAAILLSPVLLGIGYLLLNYGTDALENLYILFLVGADLAETFGNLIAVYLLLFYVCLLVAVGYADARLKNLQYNGSTFGSVGFESRLSVRGLIWLYVSNVFLLSITLGLFYPWASVRFARYRAERLTVQSAQALDIFTGARLQAPGATGSEVADAMAVGSGFL